MEYITEEKTIVLNSDPESINIVTRYVDSIYNNENYKNTNQLEDIYGNVIIAITEAVNNAIYHGNKNMSEKKIKVDYTLDKTELCFTIQDEGNGFDFTNIPDPTLPENIGKVNGRGLFLMKSLSDDITFHNNGNKVELTFKI